MMLLGIIIDNNLNFTEHVKSIAVKAGSLVGVMMHQESMKVREVIPRIGPIHMVIPLKLFLDLLRDPVFPRE